MLDTPDWFWESEPELHELYSAVRGIYPRYLSPFPLCVLLNYSPPSSPVCYSWHFSMDSICSDVPPQLSLDTG